MSVLIPEGQWENTLTFLFFVLLALFVFLTVCVVTSALWRKEAKINAQDNRPALEKALAEGTKARAELVRARAELAKAQNPPTWTWTETKEEPDGDPVL